MIKKKAFTVKVKKNFKLSLMLVQNLLLKRRKKKSRKVWTSYGIWMQMLPFLETFESMEI